MRTPSRPLRAVAVAIDALGERHRIAREPRIHKFSIVAFNMQEQRVIYRQEAASQIDFPALGKALRSLNLGTVDLKRLTQKHGDTEFLTKNVNFQ